MKTRTMEKTSETYAWLKHQVVVSETRPLAIPPFGTVPVLRLLGFGSTPEGADAMARRSSHYPKDKPALKQNACGESHL
jgi:hypothetical protein